MKKYLVLYHAPHSVIEETLKNNTEEDMKKGMEPWMEWQEKVGDALVDMGKPLINGVKVSNTGNRKSDKDLSGYSIMQAKNEDEMKKLLENHPHLNWFKEAEIEFHEMTPIPGM